MACSITSLAVQRADFLLEAVLRSLPLDLLDQDKMRTVLANHDFALFGIAVDRASANTLACRWLCDYVYNTLKLKRLFVHSEPCSLHGLALVKGRCVSMKQLSSALYSFTRWIRIGRNHEALVTALQNHIASTLEIAESELPLSVTEKSLRLVSLSYGDLAASFLWTTHKKSDQPVKTSLHSDLASLCNVVDLSNTTGSLVFHNRVSAHSEDHLLHKLLVNSVACSDRSECINRVVVPLLNFLTGKAWVTAAESRWTNVMTTVRRFLMGVLAGRVLAHALKAVQLDLKAQGSMEEAWAS